MLGKPIFFTSDWHIGHHKVLQFDERPFQDMKEMADSLITRYNSTVPHNGICYFLGDMGNKPKEIKEVIYQLNGTKVCILGNHDPGMGTMYNCGFDLVIWNTTLYSGDEKITLSHCPLVGVKREDTANMKRPWENWHGESLIKNKKFSIENEGQFHLHGHIHSRKNKSVSTKILGRQYDVGIVANNYSPVSLPTIESWIAKTKKEELIND